MIAVALDKQHPWPLTAGKTYLVISYIEMGNEFILTIKDDKSEIKDYHSKLFEIIKFE